MDEITERVRFEVGPLAIWTIVILTVLALFFLAGGRYYLNKALEEGVATTTP